MAGANEQLRVGVVGAGANTRRLHIPGLQKIEGVEVVSVANRSRESSERVAQEFNIPKTYANWRELVEAPDTNAFHPSFVASGLLGRSVLTGGSPCPRRTGRTGRSPPRSR